MRWILYVHKNKTNGKKYVGVSSRDIPDVWSSVLRCADRVSEAIKTIDTTSKVSDSEKKKAHKLLLRKIGFIEHDIACDRSLQFEHEVLFESDNMLEVLLLQRQKIRELGAKQPHGYNKTDGGEICDSVNVTEIIAWALSLDMK